MNLWFKSRGGVVPTRDVSRQLIGFDKRIWVKGDQQLDHSQPLLKRYSCHRITGLITNQSQTCSDQSVEIVIEDNGCGMSGTVMNQAIEPFFTTRPPGQGELGFPGIWDNSGARGTPAQSVRKGYNHSDCPPHHSRQVLSTRPVNSGALQSVETPTAMDKSTSRSVSSWLRMTGP